MAGIVSAKKATYHVFLVTTPDMADEAEAARGFFEDYNRNVARHWEVRFEAVDARTSTTAGVGRPQDLIREQTLELYRPSLALVVGLVGQRFEPLDGESVGFPEDAFDWAVENHRATGYPEIKFFFQRTDRFTAPNDPRLIRKALEQQEKVRAFEDRLTSGEPRVYYKTFQDAEGERFRDVFAKDLSQWLGGEGRPWRQATAPVERANGDAPPPAPDPPLAGAEYVRQLTGYRDYMLGELDRIDEEFNWSDADLTPLEAEVEVERRGSRRPRLAPDLVKAIRSDRSRNFLVIGDPGSGKSVSLRRLARELFGEVDSGGPVPVYVNLREWNLPEPPTESNLREFIRGYLMRAAGEDGRRFLGRYYEAMFRKGRFFFLLDSFDELPAVLDVDDQNLRHKEISLAFSAFLNDLHGCRGVLASRQYRQPVGIADARRVTIRPFSESRVRRAMRHWLIHIDRNPDELVRRLFRERPELAPGLRNPFMADLIARYIIKNPDALPRSYHDLYQHHFDERFKKEDAKIRAAGLSPDQLTESAVRIAWTIYRTAGVGLEIEMSRLAGLLGERDRLRDEVEQLRRARVLRLGGEGGQRVSFVHRRFAEYFAAMALGREPAVLSEMADLGVIPSDGRWREALVVYCGIATDDEVRVLAEYSWGVIRSCGQVMRQGDIPGFRPAIHCLRFLRDTCQSRPACLAAFQDALSAFVLGLIDNPDILIAKLAAEALPLVTAEARTRGIVAALDCRIPALSDAAIRSCRHLASIEKTAIDAIHLYTRSLPIPQLLGSALDLDFSLSLSDSLKSLRRGLWYDLAALTANWVIYSVVLAIFWSWVSRGEYFSVLLSIILAAEFVVVLWVLFDCYGEFLTAESFEAKAKEWERVVRQFGESGAPPEDFLLEAPKFTLSGGRLFETRARALLGGFLPGKAMKRFRMPPRMGFDTSLKGLSLLAFSFALFNFTLLHVLPVISIMILDRLPLDSILNNKASQYLWMAVLFSVVALSSFCAVPWNYWTVLNEGWCGRRRSPRRLRLSLGVVLSGLARVGARLIRMVGSIIRLLALSLLALVCVLPVLYTVAYVLYYAPGTCLTLVFFSDRLLHNSAHPLQPREVVLVSYLG